MSTNPTPTASAALQRHEPYLHELLAAAHSGDLVSLLDVLQGKASVVNDEPRGVLIQGEPYDTAAVLRAWIVHSQYSKPQCAADVFSRGWNALLDAMTPGEAQYAFAWRHVIPTACRFLRSTSAWRTLLQRNVHAVPPLTLEDITPEDWELLVRQGNTAPYRAWLLLQDDLGCMETYVLPSTPTMSSSSSSSSSPSSSSPASSAASPSPLWPVRCKTVGERLRTVRVTSRLGKDSNPRSLLDVAAYASRRSWPMVRILLQESVPACHVTTRRSLLYDAMEEAARNRPDLTVDTVAMLLDGIREERDGTGQRIDLTDHRAWLWNTASPLVTLLQGLYWQLQRDVTQDTTPYLSFITLSIVEAILRSGLLHPERDSAAHTIATALPQSGSDEGTESDDGSDSDAVVDATQRETMTSVQAMQQLATIVAAEHARRQALTPAAAESDMEEYVQRINVMASWFVEYPLGLERAAAGGGGTDLAGPASPASSAPGVLSRVARCIIC